MSTKTSFESVKINIYSSLNEIFKILENLSNDNQNLKLKAYKPSIEEAKIFLDYFSWEEGDVKQNFEIIYQKELQILNEWLEIFCKEFQCSKEDALSRIIDGIISF